MNFKFSRFNRRHILALSSLSVIIFLFQNFSSVSIGRYRAYIDKNGVPFEVVSKDVDESIARTECLQNQSR